MRTKRTEHNTRNIAFVTFGAFLESQIASALVENNADAVLMIHELRKARLFPYFGIFTGKLAKQQLTDRRKLRAYVTKAYRGDRCGIAHWRRVASLLWRAYDSFLQLQKWAERAECIKRERNARQELYQKKERERLRVFRARKKKERAIPAKTGFAVQGEAQIMN
jgi:hypothetical protein